MSIREMDVSASNAVKCAQLAVAIEERIGSAMCKIWFDNADFVVLGDTLEITVESDITQDVIIGRFLEDVREAVKKTWGAAMRVRCVVGPPGSCARSARRAPQASVPVLPRINGMKKLVTQSDESDVSLSTFILGRGNQQAYNCIVEALVPVGVNERAVRSVYVFGQEAYGKTHLVRGFCNKYAESNPEESVLYVPSLDFGVEYFKARKNDLALRGFREKYRGLRLLVLDDIEYFEYKPSQEELLHVVNAILAAGGSVVVAGGKSPSELCGMNEALMNRLAKEAGVAKILRPDKEMRATFLRRQCDALGFRLDKEPFDWIVTHVTRSLRELESALTRLIATAEAAKVSRIDVEVVRHVFTEYERRYIAPLRFDNIMKAVSEHLGVHPKVITSDARDANTTLARHLVAYLTRSYTDRSYPEIGQKLGGVNHSSVISAFKSLDGKIKAGEIVEWSDALGDHREPAAALVEDLIEEARNV